MINIKTKAVLIQGRFYLFQKKAVYFCCMKQFNSTGYEKSSNFRAEAHLGGGFINPSLKAGVTEYQLTKDFSPEIIGTEGNTNINF